MKVCSQLGPPLLNVFSWVPVAYPVAPQQWAEQGGEGGENFPLPSVGSRAGGDNRKRALSAQRRVGPKAGLTAGAPVPGQRVSVGFPFCVCYPPMYINLGNVKKQH